MFMRTIGLRGIQLLIVCALSLAVPLANGQSPASASQAPASSSENEQLRQMILDQQRQIDELKRAIAGSKNQDSVVAAKPSTSEDSLAPRGGLGQIASTAPI